VVVGDDPEWLAVSTGGGVTLAFVGAVLVLLGALGASSDGVPGEYVSAVLGIPIGDAAPDPALTASARVVLLLGPTIVIGGILVAVLGLVELTGGTDQR
jgi:hypothetical protein